MIVYNINLPASCDLPGDRFPDSLVTVLHDIRLDRQTVLRSLFQNAHIADPRKAHVQRPGDRCCRQREDIHILAHFLDLFLVGHAEALLLIDDEKAQVFKLHILGQQPVGPDDDIHHPGLQASDGFIHLRLCAETAQQADLHRIVLHPLGKCVVVLLGKDRCRHQHGDLAAFGHCLESGTDRNLCLAVPHIAADQAVHDLRGLHVFLGVGDRLQLVLRLLEREQFLKLGLEGSVRTVGIACLARPCGIEIDQFLGNLLHSGADPGFGPGPGL